MMNVVGTIVGTIALGGFLVAADTRIALLSDFHLDPFYATSRAMADHNSGCASTASPPMGTYGCDSPLALVNLSIEAAMSYDPAHVIMAGDWLRHQMNLLPSAEAASTYTEVAKLLKTWSHRVVPAPSLMTALGNNDFVPDYAFDVDAAPPQLLTHIAATLRNISAITESEYGTFSTAGFFSRDLANTSLTVVVVNTLIWSLDLEPATQNLGSDPLGQFAFLRQRLEAVRSAGRRALIVSHIPPTINFFDVLHNTGLTASSPQARYFSQQFEDTYAGLVRNFSDVVELQIFGHTHRFSLSADSAKRFGGVPVMIVGAVSPVYNNNPNFAVADFTNDGRLKAVQVVGLSLSAFPSSMASAKNWTFSGGIPATFRPWLEPTKGTHFHVVDNTALETIAAAMSQEDPLVRRWQQMYSANESNALGCSDRCVTVSICFAAYAEPEGFFDCLRRQGDVTRPSIPTTSPAPTPAAPDDSSKPSRYTPIAIVAAVLVLAAMLAGVIVYRRRMNMRRSALATDDFENIA